MDAPAAGVATPARSRLRLTLFSDIEASPRKSWLVRKLLGEGEMSVIFGSPGAGKSVLATDLAFHVAAHKPWLGRAVTGGAVLYVAAERAALVERRLAALRKHYDISDIPLGVLRGSIDLRSNTAATEEIIHNAKKFLGDSTPVRLIVIDTVSRALSGGDENSPRDMGTFVCNASTIQEATGAAVCLIHHSPADGSQRPRGHTTLLAAVDTSIGVEKIREVRVAKVHKQNDGIEGEELGFTLQSIEIADDGTTAPVVVEANAPERSKKGARQLSDRDKNALRLLTELSKEQRQSMTDGHPNVRAVDVDVWRRELFDRGVLDAQKKNPRSDFQRVRNKLKERGLADERGGQIWPTEGALVPSHVSHP